MAEKTKKIGICGGTFDPVHLGHLSLTEQVRCNFELDKILFIPSGNPPHKKMKEVTDAPLRYKMVELAIASNPYFEAVALEIERIGYTYTIDTLKLLQALYKNADFYYIIGADVVMDLMTWKSFEQVFKLTKFISVLRPGFQKTDYEERINYLESQFGASITSFDAPLMDISSTNIRKLVEQGKSIKYLVPDSVIDYIYKNGLYK